MVEDVHLFDYDAAEAASTVGTARVGDLLVTEARLPAYGGGLTPMTVVQPQRRDPVAGMVIAHGGSDDGRHFFRREAEQLAEAGCAVALPATFLPPRGDWSRTELAIRRSVVTHRQALDFLVHTAGADVDRLGFFGHSGGACLGAILTAVDDRIAVAVLAAVGSGTLVRVADAEMKASGRHLGPAYLNRLARYDPSRWLARHRARRLLLQHGRHDREVLLAEFLALRDQAAPPLAWRLYDCGHGVAADPAATRDRHAFLLAAVTDVQA
jgi:dipeptidyl aminopeptidase/acylaminoacyl peptidase